MVGDDLIRRQDSAIEGRVCISHQCNLIAARRRAAYGCIHAVFGLPSHDNEVFDTPLIKLLLKDRRIEGIRGAFVHDQLIVQRCERRVYAPRRHPHLQSMTFRTIMLNIDNRRLCLARPGEQGIDIGKHLFAAIGRFDQSYLHINDNEGGIFAHDNLHREEIVFYLTLSLSPKAGIIGPVLVFFDACILPVYMFCSFTAADCKATEHIHFIERKDCMYFPTTRVLTVLELLQSRQQMSGPELASRLEVDARTVRRYITMLQDLGIPVEAIRGRHGFYRLRPGFKLPPLMFTDEEALALTLGLLAARKMGLMAAAPAVEGALAKVERVLPLALRERVQAVQETLIFDVTAATAIPDNEVVVTLCAAAQQRLRVWLRYKSYSAPETERCFDPYGLVYHSGFWYTVGYCHLRSDLRTFRLDRIQQMALRSETFTRPLDFDCLAFVLRSISQTPGAWLVDVLLETTLEEARRVVPPTLATLEQDAGGIVMRCYVEHLDWIAYILVGLRCPLIIRQPPELRTALHELAARVTGLAERG